MQNLNYSKYWDYKRDDYSNRPNILFQDEYLPWLLMDTDNIKVDSVIDLGCGTGNLVCSLVNMGFDAIGITYNPEEVQCAELRELPVLLGDMHELPFDDDTFDAAVMWDSLEHCVSPYIALCEMKRVLKDYGKGLIFMPGMNWLNCHNHIMTYSVEQMKQLFRQAGLRYVVNVKKYPDNPNKYCEGMAVYQVEKIPGWQEGFSC